MKKTVNKVLLKAIVTCLIVLGSSNVLLAGDMADAGYKNTISDFVNQFVESANKHDIVSLASYYGSDYLGIDNLSKDKTIELLQTNWSKYPDMQYKTEIKDIRISNVWATVEIKEISTATTSENSNITNDKGLLTGESHYNLYLRRYGKEWKIIGDSINYERSVLKYGTAKKLAINFASPDQVRANQMYSAKLDLDIPVGSFIVASITQEPIVNQQLKIKEAFKNLDQNEGNLERVFISNDTNNNEVVTATVGVTELTEDAQARPIIELKGIYVITNRVNVVPESKFDKEEFNLVNKANIETDSDGYKTDDKSITEPDSMEKEEEIQQEIDE